MCFSFAEVAFPFHWRMGQKPAQFLFRSRVDCGFPRQVLTAPAWPLRFTRRMVSRLTSLSVVLFLGQGKSPRQSCPAPSPGGLGN